MSVLTGAKAVGLNRSVKHKKQREREERGVVKLVYYLKYRNDKPKNGRATRQQFKKSAVGISFVAVSCMLPNLYDNQVNIHHLRIRNDSTTFTITFEVIWQRMSQFVV